jgi:glycosyltransferase involved in cell wall biosynthesis
MRGLKPTGKPIESNLQLPESLFKVRIKTRTQIRVNTTPRVVFLESQEGLESLFTRGLRSGATAAGWEAEVIFLADASGQPRTEKDVRIDLLTKRPDTVCFLMDAPLDLKNLWDAPSLASVQKLSLWFDDYYRSPKTLAHPEIWTDWQKNHGVSVGIWDGYWRCQWKMLTGYEAFPIHLAADPRMLRPNAEPWNRDWSERAVFTGTIPSFKSLDTFAKAFPVPLRRLLEDVCAAMNETAWPFKPYDIAQGCRSFLGIKYGNAIDAMLKDPTTLALWNHLLWRWGKRIARLRGLAAVAQAGPLAILSGHGVEAYAGEEELRTALPEGIDLVFADTCKVPSSAGKGLFRTGKWQVQITDPQSIESGIPFRVFECGACGVPLMSDGRPGLEELFPSGTGLFTATNESALQETAARLFQTPRGDLEAMGKVFHQNFIEQHTWEIRWRQLTQAREPRAESPAFFSKSHRMALSEKLRESRSLDLIQSKAHNEKNADASARTNCPTPT